MVSAVVGKFLLHIPTSYFHTCLLGCVRVLAEAP